MDIGDLDHRTDEELVRGLWDAMDAEDTAKKVKAAIREELRRRLGDGFENSTLQGNGRELRAWWSTTCKVIDRGALERKVSEFGMAAEVYTINTPKLLKLIRETDAEDEFRDCLEFGRALTFQRKPGDA